MAKQAPLFVAPSGDWTQIETIEAFAKQRERELVRHENGTYSFVDGFKTYHTTIVSTGGAWVFAVYQCESDSKEFTI
jgi:hypothetical protein